MGSEPARSVVDAHGEIHGVKRLFLGDGSVVSRTVSSNPSPTIMALATRLADHLHVDAAGYLERAVTAWLRPHILRLARPRRAAMRVSDVEFDPRLPRGRRWVDDMKFEWAADEIRVGDLEDEHLALAPAREGGA
jgi:GMC oxidoreductase